MASISGRRVANTNELLNKHVKDLVIEKGARGFGVGMDEAYQNIYQMLQNPDFNRDVKLDGRIAKYRMRADPELAREGLQAFDAIQAGVPVQQIGTAQLGLAAGIQKHNESADRLRRKREIIFGLHPEGVQDAELMDDLRLRSDYQAINLEKTNERERANALLGLVREGRINVQDLNNADLGKVGVLNDIVNKHARQQEQEVIQLGKSLWNERNPNDQVNTQEFSRRTKANQEEGQRMAGDRFVGNGAFGIVFENKDKPGMLTKQEKPVSAAWNSGVAEGTGLSEIANLKRMQGTPGVPKMGESVMLNDGSTRFDMEDLRDNYTIYQDKFDGRDDRMTDVRVAQQLGGFNLKGFDLDDRHRNNIMINETTGRPMQIDFGIGSELDNNQSKAIALCRNTVNGFRAAGLTDEAEIFGGLVWEMIQKGRADDAWDIAKQGFSRLQKIKEPVMAPSVLESDVPF